MTHTDPLALPPTPDPSRDRSQSLSNGAAGTALLHIAYAHAGVGDWGTAHRWAGAMTRGSVVADPEACGLFRGAPAVAFVLRVAARSEYAAALRTLDGHITTLTRHRLERAYERIERAELPELREFDLINGLTGIGVYLLQANHTDLLRDVLSYLVRLVESVTVDGQELPGWWTSNGPADQPAPAWSGGHGNLGLAHGIAGPLALLATAMRSGVIVPGHPEALDRICVELDQWRCGSLGKPWWPGLLSPTEWRERTVSQRGPQRPSWCYGTPGLARAQQLAALALGDRRRQHRAENALVGCITDQRQLDQLGDLGVCHGWAGLVHTTRRAAADAGPDSALAALLPALYTRFEQQLQDQEPPTSDGLLEGAAGIALTRRNTHGTPFTTPWDACLLLTPRTPPALETLHMEGHG